MNAQRRGNKITISPSLLRHLRKYIATLFMLILTILGSYFLHSFGVWVLIVAMVISILFIYNVIYTIIYTKLYKINLSEDTLEFRYGVFHKKVETIEMHRINDFTLDSTLMEQILSLATVTIHSTDHSTPKVSFEGLEVKDAKTMVRLLQKYSSDSFVKHYFNKKNKKNKRNR